MKPAILTVLLLLALCTIQPSIKPMSAREELLTRYDLTAEVYRAFDCVADEHLAAMLAICKVESNFNPKARNKSGAVGLMQIHTRWHKVSRWSNPASNVSKGYETYLDCLARSSGLKHALCLYNGDMSGKYAKRIMRWL